MNFGFTGKGNTSRPEGLADILEAGALGLKLHEDWGTTPAAIDTCLEVAERFDVQVTIHTDTLNESGFVDESIAAFEGRTIHTYHSEGAGGGHAPDIIKVCGSCQRAAVVDQPDPPVHGQHARRAPRHVDGVPSPRSVAARGRRVRREPHSWRDHRRRRHPPRPGRDQHDVERQPGDGPRRRGHHAHLADRAQDEGAARTAGWRRHDDNLRIRRYVAKYTINPAIAHGIAEHVGSVEVGKLADLVLWRPAFFGVKPEMVIKGGFIAWAQMGDANASIPTPEPVLMRPMFGAFGRAGGADQPRVRLAAPRGRGGRAVPACRSPWSRCAAAAGSASAT